MPPQEGSSVLLCIVLVRWSRLGTRRERVLDEVDLPVAGDVEGENVWRTDVISLQIQRRAC